MYRCKIHCLSNGAVFGVVDTENNPASAMDIFLNRHALDAAVVARVATAYNAAKIIILLLWVYLLLLNEVQIRVFRDILEL